MRHCESCRGIYSFSAVTFTLTQVLGLTESFWRIYSFASGRNHQSTVPGALLELLGHLKFWCCYIYPDRSLLKEKQSVHRSWGFLRVFG